jgi:hypothetical protein
VRNRLAWAATGLAGLVYGAVLVYLRGTPALLRGDAGTFVSVAARMLKGDRLYADVFDNKDPLFFYGDAAALAVGGWRGPSALDALWLAIAAVATAGFLRSVTENLWAALFGFVAYPLLLTASWYSSGYSLLAALALAPLVAWLAATKRWLPAGVVLGLALLFKSNLGLVLVAAPVALLVAQRRSGDTWRSLGRYAVGTGAALALAAVVLGVRGELGPYLGVLHENLHYANDVLAYREHGSGIPGHVRIAFDLTPHRRRLALVLVGAVVLAVLLYRRRRASRSLDTMGLVVLATGAATAVTLALTAVWGSHMQMLAYAEALLLVYAGLAASALAGTRVPPGAVAAVVSLAGLWVVGGFEPPGIATPAHERWTTAPPTITATALEQAATRYLPGQREVTYARLGSNDDGHAEFLDDRFSLACARFHQYRFTRNLDAVLRCVATKLPDEVVTAPPFGEPGPRRDAWRAFVLEGRGFLSEQYRRVSHQLTPYGALDVWVRR